MKACKCSATSFTDWEAREGPSWASFSTHYAAVGYALLLFFCISVASSLKVFLLYYYTEETSLFWLWSIFLNWSAAVVALQYFLPCSLKQHNPFLICLWEISKKWYKYFRGRPSSLFPSPFWGVHNQIVKKKKIRLKLVASFPTNKFF